MFQKTPCYIWQHKSLWNETTIFKRDAKNDTFKYFQFLQKHRTDLKVNENLDIQSFQMQFSNTTEPSIELFASRFTPFK